jgi:hypothetical protein
MNTKPLLIDVDARKRISLGALALHDHYLGEIDDDGVITLVPAVITPMTRRTRPGPKAGEGKL